MNRSQRLLVPSQRRLQRAPDFTGDRLNSFRDVFFRHGLPGALLGAVCLLHPQMRGLFETGLTGLHSQPLFYIAAGLVLLVGLNIYTWYIDGYWRLEKLGWVIYLGAVSAWEEWVFRLALPYYLEIQGAELLAAVITANLVFGIAHYFTLRWKWQWCVAVFFFGMALSRQMDNHFNLLLVIGIHWVATFVNTPRLPGRPRGRTNA